MGLKVGDTDLFGGPARRGGHDLHQARGAHTGSRIHDEAAFLPDQAVDVGWIEVDLLGARHHRFFERHGEALLLIDDAFSALTGVDAAVPQFAQASQVGRGQQLAVAHAAFGVQVGGVVPLAHTLGAQANLNGVQAAHQACVFRGGLFFFWQKWRWASGHRDSLAQGFQRHLLIKAAHASQALQRCFGL